ncbi:MAG: hypothetical protein GY705_27755 [Bacteroidetes bacterium]|nr:hypothetical protein [Bacteroidota bacterium]
MTVMKKSIAASTQNIDFEYVKVNLFNRLSYSLFPEKVVGIKLLVTTPATA